MGREIFWPQNFALVTVTSSHSYCVHGVFSDISEALICKKAFCDADIIQICHVDSLDHMSCSEYDRFALIAVEADGSIMVFGSLTTFAQAQQLCQTLESTYPRMRIVEIGYWYNILSLQIPLMNPGLRTDNVTSGHVRNPALETLNRVVHSLPSLSFLTDSSLMRDVIPLDLLRP